MKNYALLFLAIAVILIGCAKSNQELYEEVMDIHDEVMPKMEAIYNRKGVLKDSIANTPDMPEEKKKEIEDAIAKLDAASKGMEEWMHKFNPIPDSLGEEQARAYLENEKEKIRKVKEDMLDALESSKP